MNQIPQTPDVSVANILANSSTGATNATAVSEQAPPLQRQQLPHRQQLPQYRGPPRRILQHQLQQPVRPPRAPLSHP